MPPTPNMTENALTVLPDSALSLDQNPAAVYLAGLAPTGRRSMAARLQSAAQLLGYGDLAAVPWATLRFQHLAAIRAKMIDQGKASTSVNTTICALRGVARNARSLGQMTGDDYATLCTVTPARGVRLPAGRALTAGEIGAMLGGCGGDPTPAGARDGALLAIGYGCGLRRAELASLDLADYDASAGALRVHGKGNKQRSVPLAAGASAWLGDWLKVRGNAGGAMFWPVTKGGDLQPRRLTAQAVYDALAKRARAVGVEHLSPHDLRRTFAGDLLDAGADIATVQKLMGHANVNTTARYDRRGEDAKRRAVALLHVPHTVGR